MMNLIGKWRVAEALQFNPEKFEMEWTKTEDILAQDDREMAMMVKTEFTFWEDGTIELLSPIPEDVSQKEVDDAVAAGVIKLKDGMMFEGQYQWKTEGGKNYSDMGLEGEVMGEKVGPWEEIKEVGDGKIQVMLYRLERF
jgi:hypothetical protein